MAEIAHTRILWLKKVHAVDDPTDVNGKIRLGLEVTNASTGGESWDPADVAIAAHLSLPSGLYVEKADVEDATLPGTIAAGATFQTEVSVLSDPDTEDDGVTPADLFHPDTLVVCDVLRDTDTWLGGEVGQMYVGDSLRDRFNQEFVSQTARRHMRTPSYAAALAPTSGDEVDVIFNQIPSGRTVYLRSVQLTATVADQYVIMYAKRGDDAETPYREFTVEKARTLPVSLDELRFNPGDSFRFAIQANADGGRVAITIEMIDLPWEER